MDRRHQKISLSSFPALCVWLRQMTDLFLASFSFLKHFCISVSEVCAAEFPLHNPPCRSEDLFHPRSCLFFYLQAKCCSDHLHCCYEGTDCDLIHGKCVNKTVSLSWMRRVPPTQALIDPQVVHHFCLCSGFSDLIKPFYGFWSIC